MSLSSALPRCVAIAGALALLGAPSPATDYHVDAVHGDDASDGLTPATAWRTLSFALGAVPAAPAGGLHRVLVAPGVYGPASGEAFPLRAPGLPADARIELVGAGPALATVDGGGVVAGAVLVVDSELEPGTGVVRASRLTRVSGLRILAGADGVAVGTAAAPADVELADLVVEGGTGRGMLFHSSFDETLLVGGPVDALLERVEVVGFDTGLRLYAGAGLVISTQCVVEARDCVVRGAAGDGVSLFGSGGARVVADGLTVRDCGGAGVAQAFINLGSATLIGKRVLVAGNAGAGIALAGGGTIGGVNRGDLERATVAHNAGGGLVADFAASTTDWQLDSSLLWGNGVDLDVDAPVGLSYCDVRAATQPLGPTSFSADPLFVQPAAGDLRLQDGSPCVDAGSPLLPPDPDGTVADVGALPYDQGAVARYCTGKTSSLGCVPFMASQGFASASAPQPFRVQARDVLPGEAGLLLYGHARANLAFHGGRLCVKAPVIRWLPAKGARATGAPPCPGVLSRDFNARIRSGVDPLLTAGGTVFAQWRQRDPADPAGFGDSLSDGLRFVVQP